MAKKGLDSVLARGYIARIGWRFAAVWSELSPPVAGIKARGSILETGDARGRSGLSVEIDLGGAAGLQAAASQMRGVPQMKRGHIP